jgi:hypothetical protein
LSLDAASALAVAAARATYRLPYHRAHMAIERTGQKIRYRSRRAKPAAELIAGYRPDGTVFRARPGTLEHFLTERYCMYVVDERQRIRRADIHHAGLSNPFMKVINTRSVRPAQRPPRRRARRPREGPRSLRGRLPALPGHLQLGVGGRRIMRPVPDPDTRCAQTALEFVKLVSERQDVRRARAGAAGVGEERHRVPSM